jgi:phenylalanyl-tRNA synthetase beta chain
MKVSLNWLKDYVPIELTAVQLAEKLNMSGTAVEAVTYLGAKYKNFVVGLVKEVKPHPQADKLRLCQVAVEEGKTVSIVCGDPNVAQGQKVAVALPGAVLPSGVEIKKAKIRGELSEGMLCSEAELELGPDASGILVLPAAAEVGQPLAKAVGFDDWVLELEITPNRPDCLGLIGVAREVAALTGKKLRYPEIKLAEVPEKAKDIVEVKILDAELCPRYSARIVKNVKVQLSPAWLKRRLEAVGIRAINNVVDVTNYVLVETGQPLHAFDLRLLKGRQVIVRRAQAGERLETIDHVERELTADMLVIADAERAVALAGIMGGAESEINEQTTDVLIESANFLASNIMRTSRQLGLMTESWLGVVKVFVIIFDVFS